MQFIQFYKNLTQKKENKLVRKGADKQLRAKSNLQKYEEEKL